MSLKVKSSSQEEQAAPGKNIKKGSFVKLFGLASEKGKHMNQCIAEIIEPYHEGRFAVTVVESEPNENCTAINGQSRSIKIKPMNMRVVCSNCFKDGKDFKVCSLCSIACYCDKSCQIEHWKLKEHKLHCAGKQQHGKESQSPKLIVWDKSMDHPSWSQLSQPSRHNLRELHERSGCRVPWPVSCEPPAMLDCSAPSFFVAHPNMKFRIQMEDMINGGRPEAGNVTFGRMANSRPIPTLTEKVERPIEEYAKKVPYHSPLPIEYGIIGEVIWTKADYEDMDAYFRQSVQKGVLFKKWPGAESVGICPGTGKRVPFSRSKKHLLILCNMMGTVIRDGDVCALTRLMPRILTIEGYHKLLGPDKEDGCIPKRIGGHQKDAKTILTEFYPKQLRIFNANKPKFLTASMAYDIFHQSDYKLYERYLERKMHSRPHPLHISHRS